MVQDRQWPEIATLLDALETVWEQELLIRTDIETLKNELRPEWVNRLEQSLKRLPRELLKADGSFLLPIGVSPEDRDIWSRLPNYTSHVGFPPGDGIEGISALGGFVTGAAIGSVIPVIGTAIGGAVGAVGGSLLGSKTKMNDRRDWVEAVHKQNRAYSRRFFAKAREILLQA